ncbi:hypothetical protein GYB57_13290 [bacterium]|nr:hypothetical protein [bacterium]
MKKILTLSAILFLSITSFAQCKYNEGVSNDDIQLFYQWKRAKLFDKNSDIELRIKIKNLKKTAILVDFNADYYLDGVLQETSVIEDFCIKSKRTARGKVNGIIIKPTPEIVEIREKENFKLEFSGLKSEQTEACAEK